MIFSPILSSEWSFVKWSNERKWLTGYRITCKHKMGITQSAGQKQLCIYMYEVLLWVVNWNEILFSKGRRNNCFCDDSLESGSQTYRSYIHWHCSPIGLFNKKWKADLWFVIANTLIFSNLKIRNCIVHTHIYHGTHSALKKKVS